MLGTWQMFRTQSAKYPFYLAFDYRGNTHQLALTGRWPTTKEIFCHPVDDAFLADHSDFLQRAALHDPVGILDIETKGRPPMVVIHVTLNRARLRESWFRVNTLRYKTGERQGTSYQRILWTSPTAAHAPKKRKYAQAPSSIPFQVLIDSREQHPLDFPAHTRVERRQLPFGDYALLDPSGTHPLAVVERKSIADFIAQFSAIGAFHDHLSILERYPYAGLVIEAGYLDALNPKNLHTYTPDFAARTIAEMQVSHRALTVHFAQSRQGAMRWVLAFFGSIWIEPHDSLEAQARAAASSTPALPAAVEVPMARRSRRPRTTAIPADTSAPPPESAPDEAAPPRATGALAEEPGASTTER
jgi:hypothetical protein